MQVEYKNYLEGLAWLRNFLFFADFEDHMIRIKALTAARDAKESQKIPSDILHDATMRLIYPDGRYLHSWNFIASPISNDFDGLLY